MTADALHLLRALLRNALAAEEGAPVAPVPLGVVPPPHLLQAVRRHRVPETLRRQTEVLGLPPDVIAALDAMRARYRHRLLLQTLETVRVHEVLAAQGIDALAFKGLALAVQTTGQADTRGPGDVDVLVPPDAVVDAHRALVSAGWSLQEGSRVEPGTWAWRHVNRWGNALTYRGEGADVDLHWRLEATPGAHPEFPVLWSRRDEVLVGSARLPALGTHDALRHSASHREGWVWLRTLVDLRRLARDPAALEGELRPAVVASLAVAREAVGVPADVPDRVHTQLDRVPDALLARARRYHRLDVPATFAGGVGSALSLRNRLASSRTPADLQHAAVTLVLPAHAALPIRSRTGWTGVPRALLRRAGNLVRSVLGRVRRGAPCAAQPGRVA